MAQLEVDRPDAEAAALDDGSGKPRDHVAAARCRSQREAQLPRRPRLLDPLEPAELLGRRLLHVLRLLLLATLAVAALLPLPHPARLLLEPLALGDVARVGRLVPLARGLALGDELAPAAGVDANPACLRLQLDDARHPLEEGAVVGDGHDTAPEGGEKALQQLEPGEVEVVRRLVEQQHLGVGGQDRLEIPSRRFATREPVDGPLLDQVGDAQIRRLTSDRARVRLLGPGQQAQQGRLADPVRADDADPAGRRDGEREPVEDDGLAVGLADRVCGQRAARSVHAENPLPKERERV